MTMAWAWLPATFLLLGALALVLYEDIRGVVLFVAGVLIAIGVLIGGLLL